ncbi:6-hydroxymethylpterin diphosphokinase MptE-like protein [Paenibacillus sp. KS-LC4]|uniref:motility associated factor glycosyltransferase family protein n=1 Tax=Paenibacillus sp. KS-LC4 TaxID=2979727 RepID=UPI0030D1FC7F
MEQQQLDIEEVIEDISVFLPKLIAASETVQVLLYESLADAFWDSFAEIVEGMDDLYRTLNAIDSHLQEWQVFCALQETILRFSSELEEGFGQLNAYMDNENYMDAGDCLGFELIPMLRQLAVELGGHAGRQAEAVLFQSNLEYLAGKFPEVYKQITACSRNREYYQTIHARNGQPNLCIVTVDGKPSFLYSKYDPQNEIAHWIKNIQQKVQNKSDIIIYGTGFGYHQVKYAQAFPEHKLHFYEPDVQILIAAMHQVELKQWLDLPNVKNFVVGGNATTRGGMFYTYLKYLKGEPEIIALPVYEKLMKEEVLEFSNDAKIAIMNYGSSYRMYERFGMEWLENSMYNLPATLASPSIQQLENKFADVPAVIVGAGPSLSADIENLKKLKQHAFIIAAGSSIQSLLHFGIKPHLIVSMDGAESNYQAFRHLDIKGIPLLYTPQVKYRILEEKKDRLMHVHFKNDSVTKYFMQVTSDDPIFLSSHSVTGTAIQAAAYMGCKEIIFAGQDLSYSEGAMYASGAKHVSESYIEKTVSAAELTVENVNGTLNRTNKIMKLVLADVEDFLEGLSDIRFVNTSRYGARIRHTSFETMDKVLLRLQNNKLPENFLITAMESMSGYSAEKRKKVTVALTELPQQMFVYEEHLKRIKRNIGKAVENSRKNPQKSAETIQSINKDWQAIVASVPFTAFGFMLFRNELNEFERDLPELANEQNIIKKSDLAQTIMLPLITKMLYKVPDLKEVVEGTLHRLKEYTS